VRRYLFIFVLIGCLGTGGISLVSASGSWITSVAGIKLDAPVPGWPGEKTAYMGRYRLISSSDAALARRGQLTVFLRKVPGQKVPVLSGILALYGTNGMNVFYLTHFAHADTRLWTSVNMGIYTGPVIGQFNVQCFCRNQLHATLAIQKGSHVVLRFVRFSKNPHP
jgi:hypothetical protein